MGWEMVVANSNASSGKAGDIEVGQRIWLQRGGRPVMGMGTFELLVRVEATGSLHRAASDMGMAYSKAWLSARRAEANLGFALLDRQIGGKGGGGSTLSPEAKWLVGAFGALVEEANLMIEQLRAKHLGNWPHGSGKTGSRPGTREPLHQGGS
jgi:molybdate transport system regulatory protein